MLLFVSSIILVVFSAIGLLGVLALFGMMALLKQLDTSNQVPAGLWSLMTVSIVLALVVVVYELTVGIVGIKNAAKPEKATMLLGLGIGLILAQIVSSIFTIVAYQDLATYTSDVSVNAFSTVTGFVLPVLFVIGAVMLRKQAPPRPF